MTTCMYMHIRIYSDIEKRCSLVQKTRKALCRRGFDVNNPYHNPIKSFIRHWVVTTENKEVPHEFFDHI